MVRVLQRAGTSVDFPPGPDLLWTTSVQCWDASNKRGRWPKIRSSVFENTPEDIVIPSGSCAGMVKHGYRELFADDSGLVAARSKPSLTALMNLANIWWMNLGIENITVPNMRIKSPIIHHATCCVIWESMSNLSAYC